MGEKHYMDDILRYIYVLELEEGCYYIGQTQKTSYEQRMKRHFDTKGKSRKSAWVKLHKAIKVIELIEYKGTVPYLEKFENDKTIEYMKKYGVSKVRGGYYCQADVDEVIKCLKAHGYNVATHTRR